MAYIGNADNAASASFNSTPQSVRWWNIGNDTWIWAITFFPPAILMVLVWLQPWVAPGDLLRDPLAVAEMHPDCCKVYYGAVSNLGVLTWTAGAAISLFAALILSSYGEQMKRIAFFLSAAFLTGFLAMDDLFLVHENVLPAFGVPEPVTYAAYASLGLAYLCVFWRNILENRYWMFIVAGGLLATSVTIDWFVHSDHPLRILLEDGAKLSGIFAWTTFHILAAISAITRDRRVRGE